MLQDRLALDPDLSPEVRSKMLRFVHLLVEKNQVLNLTRITDPKGLYELQLRDSLQLLTLHDLESSLKLLDLGTGAGFPGMVLKIARPDWEVTLVDSVRKKLVFLDEVIEALELEGISTLHARAEDLGQDPNYRETYDLVTARAVAQLPVLAEYCLPLVKQGGHFVAWKTKNEDLAAAEPALKALGGHLEKVQSYQNPSYEDPQTYLGDDLVLCDVVKLAPTPKRYPRHAGIPKRKPLV